MCMVFEADYETVGGPVVKAGSSAPGLFDKCWP
jgi:hypothetical protein